MSTRHLECLFRPHAIVVIGAARDCPAAASDIATQLRRNLAAGGFAGPLMQVDAAVAADALQTLQAPPDWTDIDRLAVLPELALIDAGVAHLPALIDACGRRGTRAAILFGTVSDQAHMAAVLVAARKHRLRIFGPDSAGLIVPALGLHASLMPLPEAASGSALASAPASDSLSVSVSVSATATATAPLPPALPGTLAFVSQSGALASAALDWASARGIGFSKFVAVGGEEDVDLADLLDFLARDPNTQAILLYVEQIRRARKFLSAARAAARGKPVVILKAGRAQTASHAADLQVGSHAGALTGMDEVADAAIRRAGMLRVATIQDLFGAAQILAQAHAFSSDQLRIIANGAGPALLAADALLAGGGQLAGRRPAQDGLANPWNLGFGATADDYAAAVRCLLARPSAGAGLAAPRFGREASGNPAADDAILLIHAPGNGASPAAVASGIAPMLAASGRTVLSCWLGGQAAAAARRIATAAGIPAYATPEDAVGAFLQMVEHRRNRALLMQVPPSIRSDGQPQRAAARALIDAALAAGRNWLSEPESKALLAAYGIPVVRTLFASGVEEAVAAARTIGFPVALKVVSPNIVHKSDVGGVVLDLDGAGAVADACRAMQARVARRMPDTAIEGFSVQAMARRSGGHELIIGAATDPVFGPVILFGQGGVAVEVMDDKSIGLPPLNMVLAHDMVSRTRVARQLAGYRNLPAADIDAICRALVHLAYLVSDLAEVIEVDINPLLADATGVIALDAQVRLAPPRVPALERLAIRPYPQELEQWADWQGSRLLLRPIRPEDGAAHLRFVQALAPEDVRYRMFVAMRQLPPAQLARFTQIDYDREMAFIATRPQAAHTVGPDSVDGRPDPVGGRQPADEDAGRQAAAMADPGQWETLGVARVVIDAATNEAEFAIIVRSDLKGQGLGRLLMEKLIAYCRSRGVEAIVGEALSDNAGLRRLVRRLGFSIDPSGEQGVRGLRLALGDAAAQAPARSPGATPAG